MRLSWAALAFEARARDRTLQVSGLGIDTFWVLGFPEQIRFFLLLYFKGSEDEFEATRAFPVEVTLAHRGEAVADLSYDYMPAGVPVEHEQGWEVNEIVSFGVLRTIRDDSMLGGYSVDIAFEGKRYNDPPYFIVRQGLGPI